jgi:hypothetical protein
MNKYIKSKSTINNLKLSTKTMSLNLSVVIGASVQRGLVDSHVTFARSVIGQLSKEGVLNVGLEEALEMFDFENVSLTSKRSVAAKAKRAKELSARPAKPAASKRTGKPSMVIPCCGEIVGDWCQAVRFNHGLHTQCTNGKVIESDFCKTCSKQAECSSTDKPPYGDIRERVNLGLEYRDPKGKQTIPFANVAKKLNLDIEKAKEAAASMGWTIPAEQLVERKVSRGRPKSAAVSDTDSEGSSKPKKRGRPKKLKIKAVSTQDDLIAKLVAEAGADLLGEPVSTESMPSDGSESDSSTASTQSKAELKAEKKAAKEAEKLAKKEAKAAQLAAKEAEKLANKQALEVAKAAKLAEKEAAKAAKLAEKEAKLAEKEAAKAAKLAEKEAAKVAKLAEKEAAKAAKLAEKEAAKAAKLAAKEAAKASKLAAKEAVKAAEQAKLAEPELDAVSIESEVDSSDDEEGEDAELPEMIIDGNTYYWDETGEVQGVKNLLLTEDGTAIGIWDAEKNQVVLQEFEE